ncbi:MAG TPA: hemolysin family protein [Acidobacteriota bacterium]|nr:hemolysin family protein [Acidobacteriota bacterium]
MILVLLSIVLVIGLYVSAYLVSLYSLAVYIDPEKVESLFAGQSRRRQRLLKKLASDSRALLQIAAFYKSFSLIAVTGLALLMLRWLAAVVETGIYVTAVPGLLLVWLLYIAFVEYLPRRHSRRAISSPMSRYLWLISVLYHTFFPVVALYRRGLSRVSQEDRVTEEEKEEIVERAIETLAEQAGIGEAIVEEDEKEMIGHIFLLDQTVVREIMSPRMDITGIERSTGFSEIQEIVRRDGHSRFPVFEEVIDRIIGILYVKDLFNNMPKPGEEFVISRYLRKPSFVPESKVIGDLLREFRAKKQHIAIVVDEYGGVSGLVTLEDILEEIVGEIQDEHDAEEAPFVKLLDGQYLVDASLLVEDLQESLGTDYEQGDYDTVGGLIYDLVSSVPDEGAKVSWHGFEFEVIRVEGQRIKKVKVRSKRPQG